MKEEYITPAQAVEIYEEKGYGRVGKFTIVDWCSRYGIGLKIGGRWKIDPKKFEQLLTGEIHGRDSQTKD